MNGDTFIKVGFWSQLVLLGMVDWGTIYAMRTQDVAWYHYVGIVVVNVVLLWVTWRVWPWLKEQRTADEAPPPLPPRKSAIGDS